MNINIISKVTPALRENLQLIQDNLAHETDSECILIRDRLAAAMDKQDAIYLEYDTAAMLNILCDEMGVSHIVLVDIKDAFPILRAAEHLVSLIQQD